jgi:paraquat-inducible protein A
LGYSSDHHEDAAPARTSLYAENPRRVDIPILLLIAVGFMIAGQVLPGVAIHVIGSEPDRYSVMGGVIDLWKEGNQHLGAILFSFSIVFPAVKLIALIWMWFRPLDARRRAVWGHRLKVLGKWSFLDTFAVIVMIGTVQLSKLTIGFANARPEPGVYFYAIAILLSMAITFEMTRLADAGGAGEHVIPRLDLSLVIAPWLAAGFLIAALFQPVLHVEKEKMMVVLSKVYSFPGGTEELIADGEFFMAGMIALCVVILPLIYFVGLGIMAVRQLRGHHVDQALSRLVGIERWAMVDVCMLGIWLVYSKVKGIADVLRPAGFWLVAGAAVLSVYCAIRVRRVY